MKTIRIGSRESRLALIQAEMVRQYIEKNSPYRAEIIPIKTTGDKILSKPLDEIGGKGLFLKELDTALQAGETDLSVHSLKDMPMEIPKDYPILGFSEREDARDVLVLPEGESGTDFRGLIGCSSRRRVLQLARLFPRAECCGIRGNVESRLKKLDNGEYGGLVLAAAGLKRLGLEHRISRYFSVEEMLPAAGQGILAVQGRYDFDRKFPGNMLAGFFDKTSEIRALAERAYVKELDGGCSSPIAAYAELTDGGLLLKGLYYEENPQGNFTVGEIAGPAREAQKLGRKLAEQMRLLQRKP